MKKQSILFIFIILILIGIITLILSIRIVPPSNQYKNYLISGQVDSSEKIIGDRPHDVYVYYPYYIPKYLCRSPDIQQSAIKWLDENKGEYQSLISVPVGLNEVIITTDCSSCDYKTVALKEAPESVNLIWGSQKCEEKFKLSEQQPQAVEHARNFLNGIETNIVSKPFNSSESQSIKNNVKRGRDEISESDRIRSNIHDSLLHAYYAEWFAWKAQYELQFFELKYCVYEVNTLLESYKNNSCFVPDYNAYIDYASANITYFSLSNSRLLENYPFDKKEPDEVKEEINDVRNQYEWVSESLRKCENSQRIINGTFDFQKPYCETRQIIFKITYVIWAIIFIYVGILIEKSMRSWKK